MGTGTSSGKTTDVEDFVVKDDIIRRVEEKVKSSTQESAYHRMKEFEYARRDRAWTLGVAVSFFFGFSGLSVNLPTVKPMAGLYPGSLAMVSIFFRCDSFRRYCGEMFSIHRFWGS